MKFCDLKFINVGHIYHDIKKQKITALNITGGKMTPNSFTNKKSKNVQTNEKRSYFHSLRTTYKETIKKIFQSLGK